MPLGGRTGAMLDPLTEKPTVPPLTPAAQYVRMSTEHQQYSTENQRDVIREYAQRRGYAIIETYADDGRSGLRIEGREALKRLIADVQAGRATFRAILAYDISRWGRFQDTDESAYYEYVCKRAGINVIYCAEQFENDGSPTATIIKSVKRAMAGEYSRELSTKVFKGQCRLIQLGYRQGGAAGYGLRRTLIDQSGHSKGVLAKGEQKSLQTDRVVLVPGPDAEVVVVRSIYNMFIRDGLREIQIARTLQAQGVPAEGGRAWTRSIVHQILTNEKYIGSNVYNRVSFKLKKKRVKNTPDMWVRAENAFPAVVDVSDYYVAQGIIQERHRVYTDSEMIELLKRLKNAHGQLSAHVIDATDGMPSSSVYRSRFGSIIDAYRLAGFDPGRSYDFLHVNRRVRSLYPAVVQDAVDRLTSAGATVVREESDDRLLINGEFTAAVMLTRSRQTPAGSLRWRLALEQPRTPDIAVIVRMDAANEQPIDYYLLPLIDVGLSDLRLREDNGIYLDTYRFESLSYFAAMAQRVRVEVAA